VVENSKIFTTCFQVSVLQDPMVTYIKRSFFFKNLALVIKMAVLECFW